MRYAYKTDFIFSSSHEIVRKKTIWWITCGLFKEKIGNLELTAL